MPKKEDVPNDKRKGQREHTKSQRFFRMGLGFLFAPLDGLYGLFKGAYYFLTSKYVYHSEPRKKIGDSIAKRFFLTIGLARIATVFVSILCILGFVGALAVPIPGVTPLYTATVLGILKAIGVTTGWAIVGRAVGFVGAGLDYLFYRLYKFPSLLKDSRTLKEGEVSYNKMIYEFGIVCLAGAATNTFFGEGAESVNFNEKKNSSSKAHKEDKGSLDSSDDLSPGDSELSQNLKSLTP